MTTKQPVQLPWAQPVWDAAPDRQLLRAVLDKVGPPTVPLSDRSPTNADALIGVAVVLDLLATRSRKLQQNEMILANFCEILLALRGLGGSAVGGLGQMLRFAQTPTGNLRATLTTQLAEQASQVAPGSDVLTVTTAVRRLEKAATLGIRHASLLLATRGVMTQQQV